MQMHADLADELAAGRPFPTRKIVEDGKLIRWDAPRVAAHFQDVRSFWADAASGYLRLALAGCPESAQDARDAAVKGKP